MVIDQPQPRDARARRSRESLRQALLTSLDIKTYDEISVRDIAGGAGVSYPTFFRNYASKADLIGEIGTRETHDLFAVMVGVLERRDPAVSARQVCDFIDSRRRLWKMLLNSQAVFAMRETFIRESVALTETRSRILPDFPIELSASFFVGSMFEVLSWWLRQPDEMHAATIARYLEKLVLRPTMMRSS